MSKPLLILGARSLADEIFDLVSDIPGYEVAAFVENMDRKRCEDRLNGLPVLWVDEIPKLLDTHDAICALGSTQRRAFIEQAAAMGARFATIVHPTAHVSSRAVLGPGCFVSPNVVIATKTRVDQHVFINRGVLVGHHAHIGQYCSIQCGANIAGRVTLRDGAYIGMSAVILNDLTVGENCIVGAGAVVTEDVPDRVQVVGVPAKIVRTDIGGK